MGQGFSSIAAKATSSYDWLLTFDRGRDTVLIVRSAAWARRNPSSRFSGLFDNLPDVPTPNSGVGMVFSEARLKGSHTETALLISMARPRSKRSDLGSINAIRTAKIFFSIGPLPPPPSISPPVIHPQESCPQVIARGSYGASVNPLLISGLAGAAFPEAHHLHRPSIVAVILRFDCHFRLTASGGLHRYAAVAIQRLGASSPRSLGVSRRPLRSTCFLCVSRRPCVTSALRSSATGFSKTLDGSWTPSLVSEDVGRIDPARPDRGEQRGAQLRHNQ